MLLKGKNIFIRPIEERDVNDRYVNWLNDSEVNRFLETRHHLQNLDSVSMFVREKIKCTDERLFAICLLDGTHIGNIKIGPVIAAHRRADVSLFIGERAHWGKGLATEAIGLLAKYAFDHLGLHRLVAGCYAENLGSRMAFERNGFVVEGQLREHALDNGTWTDVVLLGLINPVEKAENA